MSEERNADEMFEALCSNHARAILVAASSDPCSAQELAEQCDASLPTVYRRVDALVEQGLLVETMNVDPDGNHYTVYAARLDSVRFDVENSGFIASISLARDIVDRFGDFWRGLGEYPQS